MMDVWQTVLSSSKEVSSGAHSTRVHTGEVLMMVEETDECSCTQRNHITESQHFLISLDRKWASCVQLL